jgi:anti-sigma factor RsiW
MHSSSHLTEDQLRRYFLGEADNAEAGLVEEHLLACDPCAAVAVYVEAAVDLCQGLLENPKALKN